MVAPAAAQTVSEVQVTPETMTLTVGQKQPIFATAYDRQGNLIASAKFVFSSSDTSIARVSREGSVQGVAPGLAKVEARTQGRRASLAVLITGGNGGNGSATSGTLLALDPTGAMLLPGESVQVTPQALREDGSASTVDRVTWKSLKPEVASVDSQGVVRGVGPGKTIVQASAQGGLMATLPVEVGQADVAVAGASEMLGPQDAETLAAQVPAQSGRRLMTGLQWRTTDTAVAAVDSTGIVTARAPGRTEIVVQGYGQERRVPLTVYRLPQTLVVSPKPVPEPIVLPVRGVRQFSAVADAADNTPIPEVKIAWELGDTTRAGFDRATGTLTARDTGATTLTARLRGFEPVVWRVQVVPGLLVLDRTRIGVRVGSRATLTATLRGDDDKPIGPATVTWVSDHPEVASVGSGDVRGVSPGHAIVTATTPWGQAASADVYVAADFLVASNRSGSFGIYQVRLDAPDPLLPLLVDGAGDLAPARSPDGTRIAYSSTKAGTGDLWIMDADGRNPRRVTTDPGVETEPVWTPDGARLVYTATPRAGVPQLMVIRADGSESRALTTSSGGNRDADVSPDGRRVAFVSLRDGNPELYEVDLDGGEARRLTKTGNRESSPHYLPGGDLIYLVDKGSKTRVMRLPAGATASTEPVPVLELDQPVVAFDLSPDGDRIAYVTGKLADVEKGKAQLGLRVQALAPRSTPTVIPLRGGEQVQSPSF
jgi:uncharacterized protein YjdB